MAVLLCQRVHTESAPLLWALYKIHTLDIYENSSKKRALHRSQDTRWHYARVCECEYVHVRQITTTASSVRYPQMVTMADQLRRRASERMSCVPLNISQFDNIVCGTSRRSERENIFPHRSSGSGGGGDVYVEFYGIRMQAYEQQP